MSYEDSFPHEPCDPTAEPLWTLTNAPPWSVATRERTLEDLRALWVLVHPEDLLE